MIAATSSADATVAEQLLDAVGVAVLGVIHAGQQRPEAAPVLRLAGGQRQRPQRAPVEAAAKRDQPLPPRVVADQLDRRLHRLRPRVGQERLPVVRVGADAPRELVELGADRAVARVVEVGAADVDQHLGLRRDRRRHRGMAVAGRRGRHARLGVEVDVAVDVLDHAARRALHHQRIAVDERRRQIGEGARDHLLGARAGRLGDDRDRLRRQLGQRQVRGRLCVGGGHVVHSVRLCSRR